jgi:surface polysaccharide O-acyltransferase-like enzyme
MVMHSTGIFPPFGQPMSDSLFVLAMAYRTAYGVLGSYIVARLAPYRPMWHAMVLGVVGVIVSAIGAAVTWNRGPEFGPHWYPLSLVALALPQSWLGARIREMQLNP